MYSNSELQFPSILFSMKTHKTWQVKGSNCSILHATQLECANTPALHFPTQYEMISDVENDAPPFYLSIYKVLRWEGSLMFILWFIYPPPQTIVCIFSLCVHVLIYSNLSSNIVSLLLKHIHVLLCMNVCKLRNENLSTCTIIKNFKMIYNNQSFFVNFFISGLHIRAGIFFILM